MEHNYVYCAASSTSFCLQEHLQEYRTAPTVIAFRTIFRNTALRQLLLPSGPSSGIPHWANSYCLQDHLQEYRTAPTVIAFGTIFRNTALGQLLLPSGPSSGIPHCANSYCLQDHLQEYRSGPTVIAFRTILYWAESLKMTEEAETCRTG
jgi:hypothetical protein